MRIKDCPFCGSGVTRIRNERMVIQEAEAFVQCVTCGARSKAVVGSCDAASLRKIHDLAIEAWNKRTI